MRFDVKFEQYLRAKAKKAQRGTVRIENPLPGGKTRLKYDVALRHCERGAADWNSDRTAIRFKSKAVERVMRSFEIDRAVHNGMASTAQIKRLPCTNPFLLVAPSKQRHFFSKKAVFSDFRSSPQRTKR